MHDEAPRNVLQSISLTEDKAASALISKSNKQSGHKIVRITLRIVLTLLCLIGFLLSILPWGRAIARSALLLPAVVAASQPAALITNGETVAHKQMTVPSRGGTVYLDVYEPEASVPLIASARSGVLIIPGAGDNRQVPQLINFSEALAHTALVVMDMVTPTLINYDLSVKDSAAVVHPFHNLTHLPHMHRSQFSLIPLT